MGKTLVYRAKMVEVEPQEGESESVFVAVLPRSVVLQGTFQVHMKLQLLLPSRSGSSALSAASWRFRRAEKAMRSPGRLANAFLACRFC